MNGGGDTPSPTPPVNPYVDLGLPSGLLWARGNIVRGGSGYRIGKPSDTGAFFSWGNSAPHFPDGQGGFENNYNWGGSNEGVYASTPGASIPFTGNTGNSDYGSDSEYDAAHVLLGGDARVPTCNEFNELIEHTDMELITLNGINCYKFMKRTNHSVCIFLPFVGIGTGVEHSSYGVRGRYWTSSLSTTENGCDFKLESDHEPETGAAGRYCGFPIRPVMSALE